MLPVVAHVQAILSTTPERWQQLTGTLPRELLVRPPAADEWSALECLQHLIEAERSVFPVRLQALLTGRAFQDFNPHQHHDDLSGKTPEQLATAFAAARRESLPLLTGLGEADLARTAEHPRLGSVTLAALLHTWAAHDLNHTVQAERALMQPFLLGCGPWRTFFTQHDLGQPSSATHTP